MKRWVAPNWQGIGLENRRAKALTGSSPVPTAEIKMGSPRHPTG